MELRGEENEGVSQKRRQGGRGVPGTRSGLSRAGDVLVLVSIGSTYGVRE